MVEWVIAPEVPVTVIEKPPAWEFALAVSVNTLVVVVGLGLKDAVTPVGRPLAVKLTDPVKPLLGVTVSVVVPPGVTACVVTTVVGEAATEKSGGGVTIRVRTVVSVTPRPVPLMFTL